MKNLLAVSLLVTVSVGAPARHCAAQIDLPGTQPEENQIRIGSVSQCRMCHSQTNAGDADPTFSWEGGMMSQSARDPVFRAALAIANQDIAGSGEYCLRCHAPAGWLEGRSKKPDGSQLSKEDLNGISCALCHRLEDPRTEIARPFAKLMPPGIGNGMMVVDPGNVIRGPYGDDAGAKMRPHGVLKSEFLASGHVCGTCHDVSNPTLAENVNEQPPHAYGHIERTYSEWLLSDFARQGAAGTCQSCHYPALAGGAVVTPFDTPKREHFVVHGPVGGSTWVQEATLLLWEGRDMNRQALARGQQRAREFLRTAATLELTFPDRGVGRLRVTNQTGHKLPTGYPEGRRMWIHARFLAEDGSLLDEIGRYGEKELAVVGKKMRVPTLLDPQRTRVYECLPGISAEQAAMHEQPAGPSFHFVLNDVIAKDNRIPPKGFSNAAFAEHLCAPVGADYADGQHWDDFDVSLPSGTRRVEVRLMYQSVSAEYIAFLAEENRSDDWGRRLFETWQKTGMCPPEVIGDVSADVPAKAREKE